MDIDQFRHELNTSVTIVHLRIQLLQRRLVQRNGMTEESRQWLEEELATLLVAVRTIGEAIAVMTRRDDPDHVTSILPVGRDMERNVPDCRDVAPRR